MAIGIKKRSSNPRTVEDYMNYLINDAPLQPGAYVNSKATMGPMEPQIPASPTPIGLDRSFTEVDPALQEIRDQVPRQPAPEPTIPASRIGIPRNKQMPSIGMSPEAEAILNMPPMVPRSMVEQVRDYAATMPSPDAINAGIDAEAAMRREKGITSVGPRFEAPPGMMMRNEAGRGTPLLRTDRPYFAPGTMLAATPEADPYAVTPEMLAQQEQSLAKMNSAPFVDPQVDVRRKEYLANNDKFQAARSKRVGVQAERQAAVTEKAKDRRMSPQQRGMKQFIASADANGDGLIDPIAGGAIGGTGGYAVAAKAQNDATANANTAADAEEQRRLEAERNQIEREKIGAVARGKDPIGPAVASGMPRNLATRIDQNMATGQPVPNVPIANKAADAFMNSKSPEEFFTQMPIDVLTRNQQLARDFGPQLLEQFGAPALLKALGGEYAPYRGNMNYDQQLKVNQQNVLRKLLGLPGFQPTPVDDYGAFGDLLAGFARIAESTGGF